MKRKLKNFYTENISMWKDYECREVLRLITEDEELVSLTYSALIRVIFDYIAGTTDSFAALQRTELY